MKSPRVIATILLLFNLTSALAQFSGSVNADGSWNFKKGNNENADVKLKYAGKNYYVGSGLNFGHSFLPSEQVTSILDAKKEKDEFFKGEFKTVDPRKIKAGAGLDFGYIFSPGQVLDAAVSYGFSGREESSLLETQRFNSGSDDILEGVQNDTTFAMSHNIKFTAAYKQGLVSRPDACLGVNLDNITNLAVDANRRVTSGNFYSKAKNYATYSSINDVDSDIKLYYDDVFRFAKSNLKMKTGLDFIFSQDFDLYFAENCVNGQWRDSTQYRQSYFYSSFTSEPYVNLTYNVWKLEFFVRERVQLYKHAMIDKLEKVLPSGDVKPLFDRFDAKNLLSAGITYRINDRNTVAVDYGRSIARPDYQKLCPTLMIGKSEGEYFVGNPDLLPEVTDRINFSYTYTKGIFVTKIDVNYRDKKNTAEKVIDLEKSKDVTDPMVKTIFTWVNSKRQGSLGSRLDLKMNGRDVKAEIYAGLNYDTYWKNGKPDKNDFNYEIGTIVDVFLNETTKLSTSLAYISAKQSAYSRKGEDVLANIRFSKTIIKGLDIYAELKDLVDKEIYEETWNAAGNYLKVSSTNPMHRSAVLGIKYLF